MWRISSCIASMMLLLMAFQMSAPARLHAQEKAASEWDGQGSAPEDPGPLATDVSADLTTAAVDHVLRKVAGWQLKQSQAYFSQDWTYGALYPGLMAAGRVLKDPRYQDALLGVGKKFDWQLGPRLIDPNYEGHGQARGQTYDANNQALAQTYLELYAQYHQPVMIASVQRQFDSILTETEPPHAPRWWWCDALFMAPPAWVRLYRITGNKAYLDYMDRHWWATSDFLYDPVEHLYFRDSNFFEKREKNGRKLFWSRGNGWVIAGLARVIEELPPGYRNKPRYVAQFRQMAARLASLQGADGLWRPGLLDPQGYESPELSGSGFFVYAMAWGVHHGILDRRVYLPIIRKGWQGMVSHVYADGRVGSIQPIAAGPGNYKASSSYVYGVGAFLLAGSEIHQLASKF